MMRNKEELYFLIDRAIESARCRIYRVKANIGESYAHQIKAENQNELMGITIKALEFYKKQHGTGGDTMNPNDATEQAYCNGYKAGYNKGWIVGYEQAMKGIVRCKDCIHMSRLTNTLHCAVWAMCHSMGDDGFCGYGERKEET